MKNEFDIIAISETWCNDDNININSLYQIPNYTPIHQIRKTSSKGGGLVLYIHKTITFNALEKLSNNNEHIESLSVEIIRIKLYLYTYICKLILCLRNKS